MTGTVKTTTEQANPSQKHEDYDRYISQQIERTRFQVKLNEIGVAVLTLAIIVIGFLTVMTLVDHWIVDLGFWGRALSLATLSIGAVAFIALRCAPFFIKSINPIYAAKTIEQATPSAKNSLINFLLLRSKPDGIKPVVYEAVQRRAAVDLSDAVTGATIDRSLLIRLGYVLAALICFAGIYKVFSPKDPVTTVSRIITPWKEIARPSKVQIIDIQPGDVTIYRGLSLPINARIAGLGEEQIARLIYSTADGTVIDAEMELKPTGEPESFQAELGDTGGLQRDTSYRIHAGDAISRDYSITVVESPNIVVRKIEYDYPSYTQQADISSDSGDISAIEGTKVTVRAEANQPIGSAHIELFSSDADKANLEGSKAVRTLRMSHRETEAWATFTLSLLSDRATSSFVAYRVRFSNEEGQKNPEPIEHTIRVQPDISPLVEILAPTERDIQLHENRALEFEVRSVDPDFELASLKLVGVQGGATVLDAELLEEPTSGQVVRKYRFFPRNLGLFNGDIVLVSAVAQDNRQTNGTAAPNESRTGNYRIRVIEPKEKVGPEQEQDDNRRDPSDKSSEQSESGEASEEGGGTGGEQTDGESTSEDESAQGAEGTSDSSNEESDSNNESTNSEGGNESSDENSSESNSSENPTDGASDDRESSDSEGSEPGAEERSGEGNSDASETPVESDGTNDGDAFERILDHMREQGKDPDSQEAGEAQQDSDSSESEKNSDDPSSANDESSESTEDSETDPTESERGDPAERQQDEGNENGGESPNETNEKNGGSKNDAQRNEQADEQNKQSDDSSGRKSDEPKNGEGESSENKASDDSQSRGDDSKSNKPDEAASKGEPRDSGENSNSDPKNGNEKPSDGNESASDDSNADSDGNLDDSEPKSSDSSTKPDKSNQKGDGRTDSQQPSGDETNSSDSPQDGEGNASNSSSESENGKTEPGNSDNDKKQDGGDSGRGSEGSSDEFEPDDPNLEYARKATDMALEHLRDQKDNRDLLDKLGWTDEEAQEFLNRWEKMRNRTDPSTPKAKKRSQLDDVLKSLGLRPKSQGARAVDVDRDEAPRVISSGQRSKPPAEYAEQYRAYLKDAEKDSSRPSP